PEQVDAEQAHVAGHPDLLVQGQLPQRRGREDDEDGEEEQAVEDLVPHRLAEGVAGDGPDPDHEGAPGPRSTCASRTKRSSSDSLRGDTDSTAAPAAMAAARKALTSAP